MIARDREDVRRMTEPGNQDYWKVFGLLGCFVYLRHLLSQGEYNSPLSRIFRLRKIKRDGFLLVYTDNDVVCLNVSYLREHSVQT